MGIADSQQFKIGKEVERFLDEYYMDRGYSIEQTSKLEERHLHLGDRIITSEKGERHFIEYKSGIQTFYTGNIYLETVSVSNESTHICGWVYTSQADQIVYACLLDRVLLYFKPENLRAKIAQLQQEYPSKKTRSQNKGYKGAGVLVPLGDAIQLADTATKINGYEAEIEEFKGMADAQKKARKS